VGARMLDGIDKATLERLMAGSGVSLSPEEADAVIRSLARFQIAAANLLQAPSFDETIEQFYRLLEIDAASDGTGA